MTTSREASRRSRIRDLVPLLVSAALVASAAAAARREARPEPPRPIDPAVEAPLRYDVRDAASGEPIPCKLVFVGEGATPTPAFTDGDIGREEGHAIAAHDRVLSAVGVGAVHVPLGAYEVHVGRGPEWEEAVIRHLVVGPEGAHLSARLAHVVDTAGWISADLHVHAAMSSDSRVPMRDRVYEFLADGVEVLGSTDHNAVADYGPLIGELGVGASITSVAGDELTTDDWGHFGAFPLPPRFGRAGDGAVPVAGRSPAAIFAGLRATTPGAIIDVHHPREHGIGYFESAGFDAAADRAARPGFSLDFDAIEVLNGYQDPDRRAIDRVLADWFALLAHGHVVTALGNSDTHHLDRNIGGYPRNYLAVADDRPARVTPAALADAIRAHRALFTTGPFVRLRVGKAGIGEVADATSGEVRVSIAVEAAPWVDVSRVILYQSGREVRRFPVDRAVAGPGALRFRGEARLPVDADGWVVARVEGDRPLSPLAGSARFPIWPVAVTNPVFLDRDGDHAYSAR